MSSPSCGCRRRRGPSFRSVVRASSLACRLGFAHLPSDARTSTTAKRAGIRRAGVGTETMACSSTTPLLDPPSRYWCPVSCARRPADMLHTTGLATASMVQPSGKGTLWAAVLSLLRSLVLRLKLRGCSSPWECRCPCRASRLRWLWAELAMSASLALRAFSSPRTANSWGSVSLSAALATSTCHCSLWSASMLRGSVEPTSVADPLSLISISSAPPWCSSTRSPASSSGLLQGEMSSSNSSRSTHNSFHLARALPAGIFLAKRPQGPPELKRRFTCLGGYDRASSCHIGPCRLFVVKCTSRKRTRKRKRQWKRIRKRKRQRKRIRKRKS
mmetsp:Transcript_11790/g.27487  ORF Transcript_11790/g.27487 Transcript_11790/m.27487 type:complete len:330 (+) Transcript_11790:606-1595(+)